MLSNWTLRSGQQKAHVQSIDAGLTWFVRSTRLAKTPKEGWRQTGHVSTQSDWCRRSSSNWSRSRRLICKRTADFSLMPWACAIVYRRRTNSNGIGHAPRRKSVERNSINSGVLTCKMVKEQVGGWGARVNCSSIFFQRSTCRFVGEYCYRLHLENPDSGRGSNRELDWWTRSHKCCSRETFNRQALQTIRVAENKFGMDVQVQNMMVMMMVVLLFRIELHWRRWAGSTRRLRFSRRKIRKERIRCLTAQRSTAARQIIVIGINVLVWPVKIGTGNRLRSSIPDRFPSHRREYVRRTDDPTSSDRKKQQWTCNVRKGTFSQSRMAGKWRC